MSDPPTKPTLTLADADTLMTVTGFLEFFEKVTGRRVSEAKLPEIERLLAELRTDLTKSR